MHWLKEQTTDTHHMGYIKKICHQGWKNSGIKSRL